MVVTRRHRRPSATPSIVRVPDSATAADGEHATHVLDRAGLAARVDVPGFVVDLVIDAGLLTPAHNGSGEERFGPGDVEMLAAARTLVSEGVAVEELAALAMRHATNVENLIDDAIDLLKRNINRDSHDTAELVASMNRLIPVATKLVLGHFERTLRAKAMARIGDAPAAAPGAVVLKARRLGRRIDPLAVYASAGASGADQPRSVWLRPDSGVGLAAIGAVEVIVPEGDDRFSAASAARALLAGRIRRDGPDDAPAPVLVGGFSFTPASGRSDGSHSPRGADEPDLRPGPRWDGFGDCRLVLPELTVIDRPDSTWALVAVRVGSHSDEAAAAAELERRLEVFEAQMSAVTSAGTVSVAAGNVGGVGARGLTDTDVSQVAAAARTDSDRVPEHGAYHDAKMNVAHIDDADTADDAHTADDAGMDDDYLAAVGSAVAAIERGELQKVVLARAVALDDELKTVDVLDRLRRLNPACATFAFTMSGSTFLGSTPEELVTLDGARLHTAALAGTAPRGDSGEADERFAADLQSSAKNRSEHRFVVDGITEALAGLGLVDPAPAEPGLMRLNRVQHLRTPITASVQRRRTGASDMDVLRAAGALHPTAAVGGTPTEDALRFIAGHEGFDRGWYAAPVGWCDLDGNGEIGVALRCALTGPGGTRLFAGAGIVAGSDPADEHQETDMKLRAFLDVIDGLDGL